MPAKPKKPKSRRQAVRRTEPQSLWRRLVASVWFWLFVVPGTLGALYLLVVEILPHFSCEPVNQDSLFTSFAVVNLGHLSVTEVHYEFFISDASFEHEPGIRNIGAAWQHSEIKKLKPKEPVTITQPPWLKIEAPLAHIDISVVLTYHRLGAHTKIFRFVSVRRASDGVLTMVREPPRRIPDPERRTVFLYANPLDRPPHS